MAQTTYRLNATYFHGTVRTPSSGIALWPRLDLGTATPGELTVHDWLIGATSSETASILHTAGAMGPVLIAPGDGVAGLVFGLQSNGSHHRVVVGQDVVALERYAAGTTTVLAESVFRTEPMTGYVVELNGNDVYVNAEKILTLTEPVPAGRWGYYIKPGAMTRLGPVVEPIYSWAQLQSDRTLTVTGRPVDTETAATLAARWPELFTGQTNLPFAVTIQSLDGNVQFFSEQNGSALLPDSMIRYYWIKPSILPPAEPTYFKTAEVTDSSVTFMWRQGSEYTTGYLLMDQNDTVIADLPSNVLSYQETGLIPSSTLQRRLVAYNLGGTSTAATLSITLQSGEPALPTWAMAVRTNANDVIVLWDQIDRAANVVIKNGNTVLATVPNENLGTVLYTAANALTISGKNSTLTGPALTLNVAPTGLEGAPSLTGVSTSPISALWRWDLPLGTLAVRLYDGDHRPLQTLGVGVTEYLEEGLAPGSSPARYVRAITAAGETFGSIPFRVFLPAQLGLTGDTATEEAAVKLFVSGTGDGTDGQLQTVQATSPTSLDCALRYVGTRTLAAKLYVPTTFQFRFGANVKESYQTRSGQAAISVMRVDKTVTPNVVTTKQQLVSVPDAGLTQVDPTTILTPTANVEYRVKRIDGTDNVTVAMQTPGGVDGQGYLIGSGLIEVSGSTRTDTRDSTIHGDEWFTATINQNGLRADFRTLAYLPLGPDHTKPVYFAEVNTPSVRYFWQNGYLNGTTGAADTCTFFRLDQTNGTEASDWEGAHYRFSFPKAGSYIVDVPTPTNDVLYDPFVTETYLEAVPGHDTVVRITHTEDVESARRVTLEVTPLMEKQRAWMPTILPGRVYHHQLPGVLVGDPIATDSQVEASGDDVMLIATASGDVIRLKTARNITLASLQDWAGGNGALAKFANGRLTMSENTAAGAYEIKLIDGGTFTLDGLTVNAVTPTGAAISAMASSDGLTWITPDVFTAEVPAVHLRLSFTGAPVVVEKAVQFIQSETVQWMAGSGSDIDYAAADHITIAGAGTYTSDVIDLGNNVSAILSIAMSGSGPAVLTVATSSSSSGPFTYVAPDSVSPNRYLRFQIAANGGTATIDSITVGYVQRTTTYAHAEVQSVAIKASQYDTGNYVSRRGTVTVPLIFDEQSHSIGTMREFLTKTGIGYGDIADPTFRLVSPDGLVTLSYSQNLDGAVMARSTYRNGIPTAARLDPSQTISLRPGSWVAAEDNEGPVHLLSDLDQIETGSGSMYQLRYEDIDRATLVAESFTGGKWVQVAWALTGRELRLSTFLPTDVVRIRYRVSRSIALVASGDEDLIVSHGINGDLRVWRGESAIELPLDLHPLASADGGYLVVSERPAQVSRIRFSIPSGMVVGKVYSVKLHLEDSLGDPVEDTVVAVSAVGGTVEMVGHSSLSDGAVPLLITPSAGSLTLTASTDGVTQSISVSVYDALSTARLRVDAAKTVATAGEWVTVDIAWLQPVPVQASFTPITMIASSGHVSESKQLSDGVTIQVTPKPDGSARVYLMADTDGPVALRAQAGAATGAALVMFQ